MDFKFEIGMISGIAGVTNLFVAFMDSEFMLLFLTRIEWPYVFDLFVF